jgi:MFS family permease
MSRHVAGAGIVHHHLRLARRQHGLDVHAVFVLLGVSAAIWGGWLERVGPRKAGVVAACCWAGGLVLGALGIYVHQLWLMWLGSGVIGGVGLGLGYISPVSTLVKWFPDRRGMAGMAIMGFGGGAMIGAPPANMLMNSFKSASDASALGRLSSAWARSTFSS